MKTWIKGGLWGLGIGVIALILRGIAFLTANAFKGSLEFISWILLIPTLIIQLISMFIIPIGSSEIIMALLVLFIYALIGALIGWIISKIKSKKQEKKQ